MSIFQDESSQTLVGNMEKLVEKDGYPLEKYKVTTKDGYINTMYRIPHGKIGDNNNIFRPPILLCHGMICNSSMFINGNYLAYYLIENGFDVWLPNHRGTSYSKEHTDFDVELEKDKYWDFSLQELAVYDLSAFIDFILEHTGHEKVNFIGFSQGCTVFAIMAAELPAYNEKINLSQFFGCPILFKNCSYFPVKFNAYFITTFCLVLEKVFRQKLYEIPMIPALRRLMRYSEKNTIWRKIMELCSWHILGYKDYVQFSEANLPELSLTCPDSGSIHQIMHYSQMIMTGNFGKYDRGAEKNLELYGSETPPMYDLSKVTAPLVVFYGKNDMYNNYQKENLKEKMGNIVVEHIIDYDFYNHVDFLFAKDNMDLLYKHAVKYLKNYCIDKNKI